LLAILVALAALIGVAFRLDDNQNNAPMMQSGRPASGAAASSPPSASTAGGTVQIRMGDYFYSPKDATAATAGKVRIAVANSGELPREMVLARTNADPSQLPTKPDGSVNEDALNSPGEIADVAPGRTKSGSIELTPGRYVMFCNVPGHYAAGMYGTLTVK
jgi:uncharacterized cupredoxin-like copper-binding protein